MKNIYCLFLFLFCFGATDSVAQEAWTLQQCIDHALKNNLSIKQTELSFELSKENLLQSRLTLLPDLNASASQNFNYGRNIDPNTNFFITNEVRSNNFGLSSSITLFSGFSQLNTISQNKYLLAADKSNLEKVKNDISLSVVSFYLQVLYNEDLLNVSKAQLEVSKVQLDRAKKNQEIGNITQGDLLEIQAQYSREEFNLTNAENQLIISYLSLKQLLDITEPSDFKILRPTIELEKDSSLYDAPEIYNAALKSYPDLLAAEARLVAAKRGLAAARGGYSPRLTLNSSLGSFYSSSGLRVVAGSNPPQFEKNPFNDQIDQNFNQTIGFSLIVPLFNGWQTQGNVKRAKISMLNASLSADISRNQLNKVITQAVADVNAAERKYEAANNSFTALKEAFKYNEQKFNVGLINSVDYTLVKNNLSKSESDMLQAKYDLLFRRKILDFYRGIPLTF